MIVLSRAYASYHDGQIGYTTDLLVGNAVWHGMGDWFISPR